MNVKQLIEAYRQIPPPKEQLSQMLVKQMLWAAIGQGHSVWECDHVSADLASWLTVQGFEYRVTTADNKIRLTVYL